jgi:hypothetical protein
MTFQRTTAIALMIALASVASHATSGRLRVGDPLPPLQGEFLTGRDATLPSASAGKVTLILVGFTYQSRFPVEAWAGWFRTNFGTRADITFFEVPMVGGMARLGRWFIDSGMRRGTPRELHENVITVYSKTGDWKERLGHSSAIEDDAFLIVLDPDGTVQWLHHGAFEEARAGELRELLQSLADPAPTQEAASQ